MEKDNTEKAEIKPDSSEQDSQSLDDARNNGKKTNKKSLIVAVISAVIVVIALVVGSFALGNYLRGVEDSNNPQRHTIVLDSTQSDQENSEAQNGESEELDGVDHTHDWQTNWEIQVTPAETHVEHHDAVIGSETTYHTVCNICNEICDDAQAVANHKATTGHDSGYTSNVPITNDVITTPAWDETVVDTPESQELVPNGEICTICKETRNVSE